MVCEFCGGELPMVKTFVGFKVPTPCDCPEAVEERRRLDEEERETKRRECYDAAVRSAGIPSRFRAYDEFGRGNGVYLFGEQGRGKTERACGALRGYISSGIVEVAPKVFWASKTARFVSVPEWLMGMRKTYDVRGTSEQDVLNAYATVGMLCLDDLGKGQMTEWAIERIYLLLDLRYRESRPTVITSQYDGKRLVEVLGSHGDRETAKAIWSRIEGMCKIGEIRGRDWRKNS
jgi:DNA replication protein DnaC